MKVLIIIGPPGSGKGTLAELIEKRLKVQHLSTGDMLRDEVSKNTDLGKIIKNIIASGQLVSNDIMDKLINNRISEEDCKNGFILDGYPRNLDQAKKLDQLFIERGISNYKVVELSVKDDILIKRVLGRYLCSNCGAIYNEFFMPTKKQGICDICGGTQFYKRKDDNLETIQQRLELYNNTTYPIFDYYKQKNNYYFINGEEEKSVMFKKIINLFL